MKHQTAFALLIAAFIGVIACQKTLDQQGNSNVQIRMTDAPFNAQAVNVDLQEVRILYRDDSTWNTLQTRAGIYNLLQYQNGLDTLIASGSVPANSTIKELRLILGSNNTIMIDSTIYPLFIPSGSESGLKVKVNKKANVSMNDILLDFDAGLSIHQNGNGRYMLKPVVKLK